MTELHHLSMTHRSRVWHSGVINAVLRSTLLKLLYPQCKPGCSPYLNAISLTIQSIPNTFFPSLIYPGSVSISGSQEPRLTHNKMCLCLNPIFIVVKITNKAKPQVVKNIIRYYPRNVDPCKNT